VGDVLICTAAFAALLAKVETIWVITAGAGLYALASGAG
jgi:hypothetical protein